MTKRRKIEINQLASKLEFLMTSPACLKARGHDPGSKLNKTRARELLAADIGANPETLRDCTRITCLIAPDMMAHLARACKFDLSWTSWNDTRDHTKKNTAACQRQDTAERFFEEYDRAHPFQNHNHTNNPTPADLEQHPLASSELHTRLASIWIFAQQGEPLAVSIEAVFGSAEVDPLLQSFRMSCVLIEATLVNTELTSMIETEAFQKRALHKMAPTNDQLVINLSGRRNRPSWQLECHTKPIGILSFEPLFKLARADHTSRVTLTISAFSKDTEVVPEKPPIALVSPSSDTKTNEIAIRKIMKVLWEKAHATTTSTGRLALCSSTIGFKTRGI